MRYRGQAYNLTVPLAAAAGHGRHAGRRRARVRGRARAPLRLHAERRPRRRSSRCACARWRRTPELDWESSEPAVATAATSRARVRRTAGTEWTVRLRDALRQGDVVGPRTIVEQEDATLVGADGLARPRRGAGGTLVLQREDGA